MRISTIVLLALCIVNLPREIPDRAVEITTSTITVDTLITTASAEEDGVLLGRVRSLSLDKAGNLYLADIDNKAVWKFNKSGSFESEFIFTEGRGPNEVQSVTSVFLDSSGYMYILDSRGRKFLVLDPEGAYVAEKALEMWPSEIAAFGLNKVFVTGYRFSYKDDNIVRVFEPDEHNNYEMTGSIGYRTPFGNEVALNRTGFSDFITVKEQQLYLNRSLPYHFEIFDESLTLTSSISMEKKEFMPPEMSGPVVKVFSVGREILPLKDFNLVRYRVFDDQQNAADYFDKYTKDWKFTETLSQEDLGIGKNSFDFTTDPASNTLFVTYSDDQFFLVRYTLN